MAELLWNDIETLPQLMLNRHVSFVMVIMRLAGKRKRHALILTITRGDLTFTSCDTELRLAHHIDLTVAL